jgi:hypothetical protein
MDALVRLCVLEGLAFGRVKIPFFYDIAAHTRFLFAVPMLVLTFRLASVCGE